MSKGTTKSYLNSQKKSHENESSSQYNKRSERNGYQFKVILLGDIAVGKTSILRRFVEDDFSSEYICNVGVEFRLKQITLDNGMRADVKIWDTCGEEKFRTVTRQYYRDSNGVLLVFDLSSKSSFDKVQEWYDDLIYNGPKDLTIFLIGNKKDLPNREVSKDSIKNFLKQHNEMKYMETSALTGEGVPNAFKDLVEDLINLSIENENSGVSNKEKEGVTIQLSKEIFSQPSAMKKNSCC